MAGKVKLDMSSSIRKSEQNNYGYTLVELLMVVAVFTVIATLAALSIGYTLRGSKKSEAQVKVKGDIDYAISVIDRNIRNATGLDCASSTSTRINYTDQYSNNAYFECNDTDKYIASGSARLTSQEVVIHCDLQPFECVDSRTLNVNITGSYIDSLSYQGAEISSQAKIVVRNYSGNP